MKRAPDTKSIGQLQQRHAREEQRNALRELLMNPLMNPDNEIFPAVRRHSEWLRDWFAREAGWPLHVERDGARLYKRPADLEDASRGLKDFDRRRYVLLCLACAVLERAEVQITLAVLGERLLQWADDPSLEGRGFTFKLDTHHERKELVSVCKSLLEHGVLTRVAGDEEAYVHASGPEADALYDVNRRALSGMLAAVRGPSTWPIDETPVTFNDRMRSLVEELVPDTEDGRRTSLRHGLARRLLDDPVVYVEELQGEARSYFLNQRGVIASRIADATGLVPEQRAEGLAMVDADGELTDLAMPAEGTEAHITLLVAELLSSEQRRQRLQDTAQPQRYSRALVSSYLAEARDRFGKYWRRMAREPGSEGELAEMAVRRLEMLHLVRMDGDWVVPLPALARFCLGETELRPFGGNPAQASLLEDSTRE
jgi:uncharacterized protein (TIGR02678 family)